MKLSFRPFCWQKYSKCYETPERLLGDYIITVVYIIYDYLSKLMSEQYIQKWMFKVWRRFVKWVSNAASRLIIEHWWTKRMKRLKHSRAIWRVIWKNARVLCFHAGCTNHYIYIYLSLSLSPSPCFFACKKRNLLPARDEYGQNLIKLCPLGSQCLIEMSSYNKMRYVHTRFQKE